jgi:hypothetical protein
MCPNQILDANEEREEREGEGVREKEKGENVDRTLYL